MLPTSPSLQIDNFTFFHFHGLYPTMFQVPINHNESQLSLRVVTKNKPTPVSLVFLALVGSSLIKHLSSFLVALGFPFLLQNENGMHFTIWNHMMKTCHIPHIKGTWDHTTTTTYEAV